MPAVTRSDSPRKVRDVLLEHFGFQASEIHYGEMNSDGRIVVPAIVAGAAVRLLLNTHQRLDLSIDLGYAVSQSWPYERRGDHWGTAPVAGAAALGRSRAHDKVVVFGTEADRDRVYSTVGSLGVLFVNQAVLGIDPVDVAVGLSDQLDLGKAPQAGAIRIALLDTALDRIPVTLDLADEGAPDDRPRFIVHTALPQSVISRQYTERAWRGRWARRRARRAAERSRKVGVRLRLPGGLSLGQEMRVVESVTPSYVGELGTHVDGCLGLDFLYRWMPVIDFPRSTLWLLPLDADVQDGNR
jgi:hypothetical protein